MLAVTKVKKAVAAGKVVASNKKKAVKAKKKRDDAATTAKMTKTIHVAAVKATPAYAKGRLTAAELNCIVIPKGTNEE